MAIQFPNTAQNIIAGQSAGAGLMSAYSNAARNLGQSIQGIGSNLGEGLGVIIHRQREKKAAQMLEDATEEKRRYLAGDFKDDEDKAALEARYSIPESEQFTALAARIRPWSSSLSEGLLDRAKQAKAAEAQQSAIQAQTEADIIKMGGDPRTLQLERRLENLRKRQADLSANGLKGLNMLRLNDVLVQMQDVQDRINATDDEISRALGIEVPGRVRNENAPKAVLDEEAEALAKEKLFELDNFTSATELKTYLDQVAHDETLPPAVKMAVRMIGFPRYEELMAQDAKLQQLSQRERELEMQKAGKLFSRFETPSTKIGGEYVALMEMLNGWGGKAPTNFSEAKARLQMIGNAGAGIHAFAGSTDTDNSLLTLFQKALGLADSEEITAEAYNQVVGDIANLVYGRVRAHNEQVNTALKSADSPFVRDYGTALLIKDEGRPTFARSTQNFSLKNKLKDGAGGNGGAGGSGGAPTAEDIARAEAVLRDAGINFGGK